MKHDSNKQPKPQRNNNPFSLIQIKPDKWLGLVGVGGDGFLAFDSPRDGVRAGFINLYNRYFAKGIDTINQISPVYVGPNDNAKAYASGLSSITGIGINDRIKKEDLKKLGRAIERMENGYRWVTDSDFDSGYNSAIDYLKL